MIISCQKSESFPKLKNALYQLGISAINLPVIYTKTILDDNNITLIFNNIQNFNYIIITSSAGVEAFDYYIKKTNTNINIFKPKIISSGKTTTKAIENFGYKVAIQNPYTTASQLADYLAEKQIVNNCNVLQIKGNLAPETIKQKLEKLCTFNQIDVYKTIANTTFNHETIKTINNSVIDGIVFASPSEIDNYLKIKDIPTINNNTPIFCIGQTTAQHIKNKGFNNVYTATKPDYNILTQLISNTLQK